MSTPYERLCRWRDVGDGPVGYCAGDPDFGADVRAILAALSMPELTEAMVEAGARALAPWAFNAVKALDAMTPAEQGDILRVCQRRENETACAAARGTVRIALTAALRAMPLQDGAKR